MTKKNGIMRSIKGAMLKHMHGMLTCREFEDFVLRYLDDELPAKQKSVFEWHLRICRECREYLAAYRRAIEINRAVLGPPNEPAPEKIPDDLIKAILASRKA